MAQFRNRESLALEVPRYGVTVEAGGVLTVPDEDAGAFLGDHWEAVQPSKSAARNTREG